MSKIVSLNDYKRKIGMDVAPVLYVNHATGKITGDSGLTKDDEDLSVRIERIKNSMKKIDSLMKALKGLENAKH